MQASQPPCETDNIQLIIPFRLGTWVCRGKILTKDTPSNLHRLPIALQNKIQSPCYPPKILCEPALSHTPSLISGHSPFFTYYAPATHAPICPANTVSPFLHSGQRTWLVLLGIVFFQIFWSLLFLTLPVSVECYFFKNIFLKQSI